MRSVVKELFSPFLRFQGNARGGSGRSEAKVDGGILSSETVFCENYPPSPLRGTSPRMWGEEFFLGETSC